MIRSAGSCSLVKASLYTSPQPDLLKSVTTQEGFSTPVLINYSAFVLGHLLV